MHPREELAKGLVNATSCYRDAKRPEEMEACLKELRALHEEHPEKEVRKKLAMGWLMRWHVKNRVIEL